MRHLVLLTLLLGGCGQAGLADEDKPIAVRLPDEVCSRVAKEVAKLGEGGVQLGEKGEARIEEAAWLQMSQPQRDQLLQLLAYDAACAAPAPSLEQTATVRGETGRVLGQQVVTTTADTGTLLEE
jgi:hypothetical protein